MCTRKRNLVAEVFPEKERSAERAGIAAARILGVGGTLRLLLGRSAIEPWFYGALIFIKGGFYEGCDSLAHECA